MKPLIKTRNDQHSCNAKIGICCDYSTCFTNLTHFPKQDAQVSFIYLVTTLITLYNCALLCFSQHHHCSDRKASLDDGCLGAETMVYNQVRPRPSPGGHTLQGSSSLLLTFQYLETIHFHLYFSLSPHNWPTLNLKL